MKDHETIKLTAETAAQIYTLPDEEYSRYLFPVCSCCGSEYAFKMTEEETKTAKKYICYGRTLGKLQKLFPAVPSWIRSGSLDQYSGGFCICPECEQQNF